MLGRRRACSVRTLENTRACEKVGTAHSVPRSAFCDAWTGCPLGRAVPNFSPRPLSPAFSSPSLPDRRAEEHSCVLRRHSWRRSPSKTGSLRKNWGLPTLSLGPAHVHRKTRSSSSPRGRGALWAGLSPIFRPIHPARRFHPHRCPLAGPGSTYACRVATRGAAQTPTPPAPRTFSRVSTSVNWRSSAFIGGQIGLCAFPNVLQKSPANAEHRLRNLPAPHPSPVRPQPFRGRPSDRPPSQAWRCSRPCPRHARSRGPATLRRHGDDGDLLVRRPSLRRISAAAA